MEILHIPARFVAQGYYTTIKIPPIMLFSLLNNPKDYKHESASSPATDRLLALHCVFDNIEPGAQRHGV